MVELRLYLKELKDFLSTVTIKDMMLSDSMMTTWVQEEWQDIVYQNPQANPYYRALLGDYILFSYPEQLRKTIADLYEGGKLFKHQQDPRPTEEVVQEVLEALFPITTTITFQDSLGGTYKREIPNSQLYRYCNEVPIINSYDESYKIPFTREFLFETGTGKELDLFVHSSTSVVYRIPNERYNSLISRYPNISAIIHAIMYPIPIDVSDTTVYNRATLNQLRLDVIENAEDISLLVYDSSLLEEQEQQSIIDCVTNTLNLIRKRYNVREFTYENLYASAHYYLIWQILYLAIFVQRIQNIRTGDAHLYHIWNYLKSNGLEDYRDILSINQQKFIYKNLPYLLKNKGTQHVFEILDYIFFHTQNITLSGKNIIQSTSDGTSDTIQTTKKYPIVRDIAIGKDLFDQIHQASYKRYEDVLHFLAKNAGVTFTNDRDEYEHGTIEKLSKLYKKEKDTGLEYQDESLFERSTEEQTKLMSYSPISHLNTKLLELRNNNTVDYIQAMYTKFIGETLLYRASKNSMDFVIEIQLPESSKKVELPAQDWIGMMFYALDCSSGNYDPSHPKCTSQRCYHDRPPTTVYASWPYDIEMENYEIPETFKWQNNICHTSLHLASLVYRYEFNNDVYELSDNRQDITDFDRSWTCLDNGYTLRYNSGKKRWNIVDSNENIIYYSTTVYSTSVNISELGWYQSKVYVPYKMVPMKKKYIADLHMPRYKEKLKSTSELATCLHEQAIGFVLMNFEIGKDESAINRAIYHTIIQHRCIGETINGSVIKCIPLQLNLLDGKSYQEYLSQKSLMIDNLNLVLDRYNLSEKKIILYSRMADAIIAAMLPKDDPYVPVHSNTAKYRYQKLVDLFKSMTSYNLSYIDMQYADVDSTQVSTNLSDYSSFKIKSNITDTINRPGSELESKTTEVLKNTIKPTFPDQMSTIEFVETYSPVSTTDKEIKQSILDHIEEIIKIYDTKRISKSKKHTKLVTLLGTTTAGIVENMSRAKLDKIQYAVRVVKDDHIHTKIKPHFTCPMDEYIDSSTYTVSVVTCKVNVQGFDVCPDCGDTVTYDFVPGSTTRREVEYDPNIQPIT